MLQRKECYNIVGCTESLLNFSQNCKDDRLPWYLYGFLFYMGYNSSSQSYQKENYSFGWSLWNVWLMSSLPDILCIGRTRDWGKTKKYAKVSANLEKNMWRIFPNIWILCKKWNFVFSFHYGEIPKRHFYPNSGLTKSFSLYWALLKQ